MQYKPESWYEWLVSQSRSDHIYDLIHNNIPGDFEPNHQGDFVLVNPQEFPEKLVQNDTIWASKTPLSKRQFSGQDLVLIANDILSDFLEAATYCNIIEDHEGKNYIRLFFTHEPVSEHEAEQVEITNIEADENEVIRSCWHLVSSGQNRETALQYAIIGESFLTSRIQDLISAGGEAFELLRLATGFNILAIVYLWNNHLEAAKRCDQHYLFNPVLWPHMKEVLPTYLEMLMAKKQTGYLQEIFSDPEFHSAYQAHFEAYISLLVNPHFEMTLMREVVPIINRVNNSFKVYL